MENIKEMLIRRIREVQVPRDPKEIKIKNLKKELEKEDYKIIKCIEYSLTGRDLPYGIDELNKKRDVLRNRINKLEE